MKGDTKSVKNGVSDKNIFLEILSLTKFRFLKVKSDKT